MAKKLLFEDILTSEFRWPITGDAPFAESTKPLDNALIAEDNFTRLVLMIRGYKQVADLAVAHCAENRVDSNFLIYPIIFNYRHFIELSLKYQLENFGKSVGIDGTWDTHNLERLWTSFRDMLGHYGTMDHNEVDLVVASIVGQFAKIDPKSDAYRFPVNQEGYPIKMSFAATHLDNLADVMNAVSGYFDGCDGYLSALLGSAVD